MANQLVSPCPECGLILLCGAIFDAAEKSEQYGPILGLNRDAVPDDAVAGYVGMGSRWDGDNPDCRSLYQCPRCQTDCLTPVDD